MRNPTALLLHLRAFEGELQDCSIHFRKEAWLILEIKSPGHHPILRGFSYDRLRWDYEREVAAVAGLRLQSNASGMECRLIAGKRKGCLWGNESI